MSGLLPALNTASGALRAFQNALTVVQNNVCNASTPGYARQRVYLEALPFDLDGGLTGGVSADRIESARQQHAEQLVRERQSLFGRADEVARILSSMEGLFDATGESGIPKAITALFAAFSAWSVAPNDAVARVTVIERARDLATQFQQTAGALAGTRWQVLAQIKNSASRINQLVARLREINRQYRRTGGSIGDPAMDAEAHAALEELAELANVSVLTNEDGTFTVLLGGQAPLLMGEQQFEITAAVSEERAIILDGQGRDVTHLVAQGRLAAQLDIHNRTLPALLAGLDRLAAGIADRVNAILAQGLDRHGQPGAPLFSYDTARAAATVEVTAIQPDELAAASPQAPGGNGNALVLAALADAPELDGYSFTGFYAGLARSLGGALEQAREEAETNEQLLVQARALREQVSGVSLDEEAVQLIQYQRSYEAVAKLVAAINELLDTLLAMMR